jgi:Ca2+-binding RTX toxin-like protein/uncharacterized protein YkwD
MAQPTDLEQLMLELINEARLDPVGNAQRYISGYGAQATSADPDINAALNGFNVNGVAYKAALDALTPKQALAWNDQLGDAADFHSQQMINNNDQEHVFGGSNPQTRIEAAGYTDWSAIAENIFYFSENPLHGHAGFMVDWGFGPNGMQSPPGHRNAIMNGNYREVGIGIVPKGNGQESTTENFADRFSLDGMVIITGVAFDDNVINNDFYSAGEGVANLNVAVSGGGAANKNTTASGGYSLITSSTGSQTVTFSGGGLAASATFTATLLANNNYKLDVMDVATGATLRTSVSGLLGSNGGILNIVGLGTFGLTLTGAGGSNSITGAKGADIIDGGADNDTLAGGGGGDKFIFSLNSDMDTIVGFNRTEGDWIELVGFGAIQTFGDLQAIATITLVGSDTKIDFGGGDVLMLNGITSVSGSDFGLASIITGTAGPDTINATKSAPGQPFATDGKETIYGLAGNDTIDGRGGSDVIDGGADDDKMVGGAGVDTVTYESAAAGVTVSLAVVTQQDTKGAGKDTISQFENLTGSDFDDKLTGTAGANVIDAGKGNDFIVGGLGSDTIEGGDGVDTVSFAGIAGAVTLTLTAGSGTANYKNGMTPESDSVSNVENIVGGSGADLLTGDTGDNVIEGVGGIDKLDGGGNTIAGDTLSYASSTTAVSANLGAAVIVGGVNNGWQSTGGDLIKNFENLRGGAGADKLTGDGNANKLEGNAGNDTIDGGAGIDEVFGGDGNDILVGGLGADKYDGGAGNNTVTFAGVTTYTYIDLQAGKGFNGAESNGDTYTNIQNVIGGNAGGLLNGNDEINILTGGNGNDLIVGNPSGVGSVGDTLNGGGGDDTIIAFAGDKLDGGLGNDTLSARLTTFANSTVNLLTNQFTNGTAKSTIKGFENVRGDQATNVFTGNAGINRLVGEDGNDVIEGGAGADVLDGDGGNNPGIDTVIYTNSNAAVSIDLTQQGSDSDINDAPATQKGGHAEGDALYGFENAVGSKFADKIIGNGDDNIIDGGAGNDTLDGGAHGAGGDTISFAHASAAINLNLLLQSNVTAINTGGAGKDIIFGFENIFGGKGADKLTGDGNKNTIDGSAGNDTIEGGAGKDRLFGGIGTDTLSYTLSALGVVVLLTEQGSFDQFGNIIDGTEQTGGDATGDLIWGFENIIGSGAADELEGDGLNNSILGGNGGDTISGLGGKDTLDGGIGKDTVDYSYLTGNQTLTVTLGAYTVATGAASKTSVSGVAGDTDSIANFENIIGGNGNDKLTGNGTDNKIEGGNGNDILSGMAGNDVLEGGSGNDVLDGGAGDDTLNGGADSDTATYAAAASAVTVNLTAQGAPQNTGGGGKDTLIDIENVTGSAKNDTITGDTNSNVIEGGLGDDTLVGGAGGGTDTLSYASAAASVTVSLGLQGAGQNTKGAGTDNASGFENLIGGKGNDTLTGDGGNNEIYGGAGNDVLDGGSLGGFDRLIGGAGADKMTAGYLGFTVQFEISGTDAIGDTYKGGSNDDSLVIVGLGTTTLSKFDAAASSIERLNGNANGIVGTAGVDAIDLTNLNFISGVTFLDGLGGNDKITGSFAADTIFGGAGNDTLNGGADADHIYGGAGTDTLTGGTGNDTFHIKWGEGVDTITDYQSTNDKIELDLAPGMAAPLSLIVGSMPANAGPNAALLYDTDDGRLFYDSGPGAPVHIATISGAIQVLFSDFTFV